MTKTKNKLKMQNIETIKLIWMFSILFQFGVSNCIAKHVHLKSERKRTLIKNQWAITNWCKYLMNQKDFSYFDMCTGTYPEVFFQGGPKTFFCSYT